MLQIAVCDDEIGTCSDIENMVMDFAQCHALQIETEVFYSGETLYHALTDNRQFDLIFLDIQLISIDGVWVGKQIREQLGNEHISIVYISAKETYAMRLFQVRPLDFLIKPITRETVAATLEKFIRLNEKMKISFHFNIGKSVCKLYLDEIIYFACSGKKITVYTCFGYKEFYGAMREVWAQVGGNGFWTIHKSYIVNSAYVSMYRYDSVQLSDGSILPISQKYRKAMKDCLADIYRKG